MDVPNLFNVNDSCLLFGVWISDLMTVEMVLAGVISFWSGFQMWSMLWDILGDIELPINNESVEEKKNETVLIFLLQNRVIQ